MSHTVDYDIVIVGGGPGGLTAAIYAMRAAMKTILIEKGPAGGQMNLSESVENWPGDKQIGGAELGEKMMDHAKSYGLEVIVKEVEKIVPGMEYHTVQLVDNQDIKTHAVIIATGGSPRQLGVAGENENYGAGVSYCAVCDGFFYKDQIVAVVGGGDSAVEESLYLSKIASKVYLIHRRDELRAGALLQERLKKDCKIEVIWNSVVREVCSGDLGVNSLKLQDVKTLEMKEIHADGVFIFIGFNPNNRIVPAGTKMSPEGYVITDEKCETSFQGIFAVGDLREKYARQIITAASDGCTASLAAAHYVETKLAQNQTCSG
jgi:thioredoxin reductase (NADPH)